MINGIVDCTSDARSFVMISYGAEKARSNILWAERYGPQGFKVYRARHRLPDLRHDCFVICTGRLDKGWDDHIAEHDWYEIDKNLILSFSDYSGRKK